MSVGGVASCRGAPPPRSREIRVTRVDKGCSARAGNAPATTCFSRQFVRQH